MTTSWYSFGNKHIPKIYLLHNNTAQMFMWQVDNNPTSDVRYFYNKRKEFTCNLTNTKKQHEYILQINIRNVKILNQIPMYVLATFCCP